MTRRLQELFGDISPFEAAVYAGVLGVLAAGVIMSWTAPEMFLNGFVTEDGPVEWLTVPAFLALAFLSGRRALAGRRAGALTFAAFWALAAAACVFAAGEELAWGQRLLKFQPPAFFLEHNSKLETSVHCLVLFGVDINYPVFEHGLGALLVFYLFVLPPLCARGGKLGPLAEKYAVPLPRGRQSVLFIFFYCLTLLASAGGSEMVELAGAWQFLAIAARPANWDAVKARHGLPPGLY